MIAVSALKTLLDSLASGVLIFNNAVGLDESTANTVLKAASNDIDTIVDDVDADTYADLMPDYRLRLQTVAADALWRTLHTYRIWQALQTNTGNLDRFMADHNVRASELVKNVGFPLSPAQIMPPAVDPMATFDVVAPSSGLYTHVADIDTSKYGRAWLAIVPVGDIGAADLDVTVKGFQLDGQTETAVTTTVFAASPDGVPVNIGTLLDIGASYDSVTSVSIIGGTAGDAFKIVSRVERTITPTS